IKLRTLRGIKMSRQSEVRCLNCLKRFVVPPKAEKAACPNCKTKYRISWPTMHQAKVRGLA
ncbi:MAG: hypothetical protein JSV51_07305, partial [Candidatus Bathyarchaeota archaeon]